MCREIEQLLSNYDKDNDYENLRITDVCGGAKGCKYVGTEKQ